VPAAYRRAWQLACLTACSAAVLLFAGCGGKSAPKLDRADAAPLIALARRIAHEGSGGRARDIPRLQRRVISLINSGRVPGELQEPLSSAANALAVNPSRRARALETWLWESSR
jgi:hypothetical protein